VRFRVRIEEEEQAIAQQGERCDDIWVAAAGLVLEETGIFTPVITDFDAAPMSTDKVQPLFGCVALDGLGTEVVTGSFVFGFLESR